MRYIVGMRTTIAIDDDLLAAARELADHQRATIGEVVSSLLRKALQPSAGVRYRNGIPLLPVREGGGIVTMEMVNALRDDAP